MCSEPAEEGGGRRAGEVSIGDFVRMFVGGGEEAQLCGRFCLDE